MHKRCTKSFYWILSMLKSHKECKICVNWDITHVIIIPYCHLRKSCRISQSAMYCPNYMQSIVNIYSIHISHARQLKYQLDLEWQNEACFEYFAESYFINDWRYSCLSLHVSCLSLHVCLSLHYEIMTSVIFWMCDYFFITSNVSNMIPKFLVLRSSRKT